MGRTLKRVPMDFDWPLKVVWKGYCSPYRATECRACGGTGYNPKTRRLSEDWYDLQGTGKRWCDKLLQVEVDALVEDGRLRTYVDGEWKKVPRTAEEVNKANRRESSFNHELHHDGSNHYRCVKIRGERLGFYGLCTVCEGSGNFWCDPKYEKLADEWERTEPPEGPGYQMWETTSEGSPSSPVFATMDELCVWCAEFATTFGSFKATAEEWRKMLDADFVYHEDKERRMIFL